MCSEKDRYKEAEEGFKSKEKWSKSRSQERAHWYDKSPPVFIDCRFINLNGSSGDLFVKLNINLFLFMENVLVAKKRVLCICFAKCININCWYI